MNRRNLFVVVSGVVVASVLANVAYAQQAAVTSNRAVATNAAHAGHAEGIRAAKPAVEEFVIGIGDVLAVNVWKEEDVSKVVPVRSDGRISLPLVGELQAAGLTPLQLKVAVIGRLKDFVSDPEVTIVVQEIKSQKFNILGMVNHPGSFPLTKPMTVVDALALAGGFRDFAKQKDIYVLRRDTTGKQIRLAFNYKDVIKGKHPEQNVELQQNDTVVIP